MLQWLWRIYCTTQLFHILKLGGLKRMFWLAAALLPTIIPCFWMTPSTFCLSAVTKCHYRNTVTVRPVYVHVKGGEWCKNEEHLRYIKFATGWTVTLPYWAAGVKQGLTTSTPPPHLPKKAPSSSLPSLKERLQRWWGAAAHMRRGKGELRGGQRGLEEVLGWKQTIVAAI